MLSRAILAGLLLASAVDAAAEPRAQPPKSAAFEQRVVAILDAGGTTDAVEGRLDRIGADMALSPDQRLAVEAVQMVVRSRSRASGLAMADAEGFAARNPQSPVSPLLIAEAALAAHQPERSADSLIAAAKAAGPLVQLVSPSTVSKLTDELDALSDRRRTAELAKALLYSGWRRGSAGLRSYLALAAIRDEIAAGGVEQARRLLPVVTSPASLHEILIDDRLSPLRADVVRVAGPRLELAWRDFLAKTRDEWLERGDALSATAYAEALKQAGHYEALSGSFLTRFMRGYNCPTDQVARSVGDTLADSLARTGRWTKAEDVMRRSGGVSPPTYAAMLLERGDFGRAAGLFSRSLRAADSPDTKAEEKALAWLRAASACASFRAGSRAVGTGFDPDLLDVSSRMFVWLCMDRTAEAKSALISALADEEERAHALRWLQPFADPPQASAFRNEMNARIRRLQQDPAVTEAASHYGRILDWPLIAGVPDVTELPPAKTPAQWQCGDRAEPQSAAPAYESLHLPDAQP